MQASTKCAIGDRSQTRSCSSSLNLSFSVLHWSFPGFPGLSPGLLSGWRALLYHSWPCIKHIICFVHKLQLFICIFCKLWYFCHKVKIRCFCRGNLEICGWSQRGLYFQDQSRRAILWMPDLSGSTNQQIATVACWWLLLTLLVQ